MRLLLRDRCTSGMLVALTLACFVVQLFLSASACAAVPDGRADALAILCHGDEAAGTAAAASPAHPSPGSEDCRCPSGVLCGVGVAFAAPLAPAFDAAYAGQGAVRIRFALPDAQRPDAPSGTPRPFSTGPPPIPS